MKLQKSQTTFQIIGILLVALSVIFLNALVREFDIKFDATEDKVFTISEGSREIFEEMEATVVVRYFVTQENNSFPAHLRDYATRVEDFLKELQPISGGKMKLQVYDPEPDSIAEEQAEQDGVLPQTFEGNPAYFGLSFTCIDNQRAIPFLFPERETALEYEIMKRISEVSAFTKPRIGLMTPLPLEGGEGKTSAGAARFPRWFILRELEKLYEIVPLKIDSNEIPENINALIVLHPAGAGEATERALDQFVHRGGKLMLMLDPAALTSELIQYKGKVPRSSNLPNLLRAWGIEFHDDRMITDWRYSTKMGSAGGTLESLTILSLDAEGLNQKSAIVGTLDYAAFPYAGAFNYSETPGLQMTPLAFSSEQSSTTETKNFVPMDNAHASQIKDRFQSTGKKQTLALSLKGVFPGAFADTKKQTGKRSSVILIGDSDFIYDAFCVRETERHGEKHAIPLNGNISLFMSALASISGNDHLSQVRNRELIRRPFLKIEELESKAREQFEKNIKEVESQMREVDGTIEAFTQQAASLGDGRAAPPDLKRQLQAEKSKKRSLVRQLKDIRFQLRRDIHRLENQLKWINIAAIPILVALFGIVLAYFRNRKSHARA